MGQRRETDLQMGDQFLVSLLFFILSPAAKLTYPVNSRILLSMQWRASDASVVIRRWIPNPNNLSQVGFGIVDAAGVRRRGNRQRLLMK